MICGRKKSEILDSTQ